MVSNASTSNTTSDSSISLVLALNFMCYQYCCCDTAFMLIAVCFQELSADYEALCAFDLPSNVWICNYIKHSIYIAISSNLLKYQATLRDLL